MRVHLSKVLYGRWIWLNIIYQIRIRLGQRVQFILQQESILGETDEAKRTLRILLSKKVGEVIRDAFPLLGIHVLNRM